MTFPERVAFAGLSHPTRRAASHHWTLKIEAIRSKQAFYQTICASEFPVKKVVYEISLIHSSILDIFRKLGPLHAALFIHSAFKQVSCGHGDLGFGLRGGSPAPPVGRSLWETSFDSELIHSLNGTQIINDHNMILWFRYWISCHLTLDSSYWSYFPWSSLKTPTIWTDFWICRSHALVQERRGCGLPVPACSQWRENRAFGDFLHITQIKLQFCLSPFRCDLAQQNFLSHQWNKSQSPINLPHDLNSATAKCQDGN